MRRETHFFNYHPVIHETEAFAPLTAHVPQNNEKSVFWSVTPEKWNKVGHSFTVQWLLRADCWMISVILCLGAKFITWGIEVHHLCGLAVCTATACSLFQNGIQYLESFITTWKIMKAWIAATSSLVMDHCLKYKSCDGVRGEQWQGFDFPGKFQLWPWFISIFFLASLNVEL